MENEGDGAVSELNLLGEELESLTVKGVELNPMGKPAMVCSVFTEKFYNRESFKAHFKKIWKAQGGFEIVEGGPNLFLIRFNKEEDLLKVMDGRPWLFRGSIVLMQRLHEAKVRREIKFTSTAIWVKILDVPPGCDTNDLIASVGKAFGGVLDTDDSKGTCKIKVLLDIRKPLLRAKKLCVEGDNYFVRFTYDNLPSYCIGCGRLGHDLSECVWCSDEQKIWPEKKQPFWGSLKSDWGAQGIKVISNNGSMKLAKQRNYIAIDVPAPASQGKNAAAEEGEKTSPEISGVNKTVPEINGQDVVGSVNMEMDGENVGLDSIDTPSQVVSTFPEANYPRRDGWHNGEKVDFNDDSTTREGISAPTRTHEEVFHVHGEENTNRPMRDISNTPMQSNAAAQKAGPAHGMHNKWKRRARAQNKENMATLHKKALGKRANSTVDDSELRQHIEEKDGKRLCQMLSSFSPERMQTDKAMGDMEPHRQAL